MSAPTVVITAKAGPSKQMTATSFTNCRELKFEFDRGVAFVTDGNGAVHELALEEATAFATVFVATTITTMTLT